jgi:hypothetical protein
LDEQNHLRQVIDHAIKRVDGLIERKRNHGRNDDSEQAQTLDQEGASGLVAESDREKIRELGDSHL